MRAVLEVPMDCRDSARLAEFKAPFLCLLEVPEATSGKYRLHFDVNVAGDGTADEKWERITAERDRMVGLGLA